MERLAGQLELLDDFTLSLVLSHLVSGDLPDEAINATQVGSASRTIRNPGTAIVGTDNAVATNGPSRSWRGEIQVVKGFCGACWVREPGTAIIIRYTDQTVGTADITSIADQTDPGKVPIGIGRRSGPVGSSIGGH